MEGKKRIGCSLSFVDIDVKLLESLQTKFNLCFTSSDSLEDLEAQNVSAILTSIHQLETLLENGVASPLIILLGYDESLEAKYLDISLIRGVIVTKPNVNIACLVSQILEREETAFFEPSVLKQTTDKTTSEARINTLVHIDSAISNCCKNEDCLSVEHIAAEVGTAATKLRALVKATTGMTAVQYILLRRLKLAQHLLQNRCSVQEAAEHTGFLSLSYFTKSFKNVFGITPSRYASKQIEQLKVF